MPLPRISFEVVYGNETDAELHTCVTMKTQKVASVENILEIVWDLMRGRVTDDPYDGCVRAVIRWNETKDGKTLLEHDGGELAQKFLRGNLHELMIPATSCTKEEGLTDEFMESCINMSEEDLSLHNFI